MAEVNEQNLKKAERILYKNAEFVKEQAMNLCTLLHDVCEDAPTRTAEEIQEDFNKTFDGLNLKEYFEQSLKFVSEISKDDEGDICKINLMGVWIPITREEVTKYEQLEGEEREKYIDELYMRKLCERLKED